MLTLVLLTSLVSGALAACPPHWTAYGSNCYNYSTYTTTWRDAQSSCGRLATGANLASVHSLEENTFLYAVMGARDCWIGLNDLSRENDFVWTDGSPVNYTYWLPGQPNNLLDQDCVNFSLDSSSGEWDDNHCVEYKNFMCKLKAT